MGERVIILDKKIEFYEILANSDIHCSVYSTTLFESVAFGIPTIILNIPGYQSVSVLIEHKCAKFIRSPLEFLALLNSLIENPSYFLEWKKTTARYKKYFFEENPNKRIEALLKNYL